MNIKVTKDINEANAVTHSGTFHADEVFATVILSKVVDNLIISRVSEVKDNIDNKIIYDIGGGKFDHHQLGGNGKREDGTLYASCGLIWKEYGKLFLEKNNYENIDELFDMIDKDLIEYIDADDNGDFPTIDTNYNFVHLSKLISEFNKKWNEDIDNDINFLKAVNFADIVFENKLKSIISKFDAKVIIENAIEDSKDSIMYLDKFAPWTEFLLNSNNEKARDILFVIFPSNRDGFTIRCVPKELNTFENRKDFPETWAGLKDIELQRVTGASGAVFCHNNRFIAGAKTKEDAYSLAMLAINI